MKKLEIKSAGEVLYYSKLENGLEVYMVPKESLNDVNVSFTTKYGGVHNEFISIDNNKMIKVPYGIAHFLEHKMFEQESGIDPFSFFAETGTYCNAFTNYYNTSYLFSGNKEIHKNLNFLLDYVQSPYFTDKNVDKEKGIIEQEIKMYDDSADRIIYEKLLYNIFIKNPVKYSIAGTSEDINKITKENLYSCYNTFYNPSNMFLVIAGNFNPEETLEVINKNQQSKKFKKPIPIEIKHYNEPDKVEKEYEEKTMNVEFPYFSFGIKIPTDNMKYLENRKRDLYFSMIFYYLFGETSKFNEIITNEELIDSPLDIEMLHTDKHKIAILMCKSKKYNELIKKIKDNLKNINIDQEFIDRRRKVYISSIIYSFEDTNEINRNILDNIITYNDFDTNLFELINSLNKEELDKIISLINFDNTSIYIIKPIDKKE